MKNISFIKLTIVALLVSSFFAGCSDEFLKEKRDYKKTTDVIYNSYVGARLRVDNIYMLLSPTSYDDYLTLPVNTSVFSSSTEEYGGLSSFTGNNPLTNSPDFFYNEAKTSRSPWGRIRNCNDAIEGILAGSLPREEKEELLGQVYFWRAFVYYKLVTIYGGVPIVNHTQNPLMSEADNLVIPRATTRECVDSICSDLDKAAEYLPPQWGSSDWGRVTAGTALAFKNKILLWYASPLFNRADNEERWNAAYEAGKEAIDKLTKGGFGLAYADNPGVNASGWAKMFSDYKSPEAVFVTLFNNVIDDGGSKNPYKNNSWERSIRPSNAMGGGGKSTTSQMVDLFPLADGKPAIDKDWNPVNGYDPQNFFANRDPRFYRTYAFPGVRWAFSGDPTVNGQIYPYKGSDYVLWSYCWYKDVSRRDSTDLAGLYIQSGYGADGLGSSYKGVYIRKKTDDLDVNPSPLYNPKITTDDSGTKKLENIFTASAAPHIEMRYAEVLLNFAESACGANHGAEALEALRQIRRRVGYTGDCGLDDVLASNRAALFSAILYERQIELAFEGKRCDDMRRWLLWDGGAKFNEVDGAPSSWTLTGFGGNTCSYLNMRPFNGRNHTGIEIAIATTGPDAGIGPDALGSGQTLPDIDPILKAGVTRPSAVDLRNDLAPQLERLKTFYQTNLVRKSKRVDGDQYYTINYLPKYYFLGLSSSAQTNNSKLEQTIGWQDVLKGTIGVYDPIAE
jgi:hypothetical protein